jgi:hypothetical protein
MISFVFFILEPVTLLVTALKKNYANEKNESDTTIAKPLSAKGLNKRIDKAIEDSKIGIQFIE